MYNIITFTLGISILFTGALVHADRDCHHDCPEPTAVEKEREYRQEVETNEQKVYEEEKQEQQQLIDEERQKRS